MSKKKRSTAVLEPISGLDASGARIERSPNLVSQVERYLRDAIRGGQYANGRLPTKIELASQLGVSRETVRRATETLASEGLLVKFRRKGTFLSSPTSDESPIKTESTLIGFVQADYRLPGGQVETTMRHVSGEILQGALDAAEENGLGLVVSRTSVAGLGNALRRMTQTAPLRGMLFASVAEEKLLRRVAGLGLPMVLLDHDLHLGEISTIRDDSANGARLAIEYLAKLNHKRIATAYWHQTDLNPWRLQGYRQALRELGLPRRRNWEILTDLSPAGAAQAAKELVEQSPRPTAVYCFNNSLARFLVIELNKLGIRVPEDISVMGGGGDESHGLACHQADWQNIGRRGIETLLAIGRSDAPPMTHFLEPHRLILGETVGPCTEE